MAITKARSSTEQHFVMHTDWRGYLKILEAVGESRVRVTYDQGVLELMTTSEEHEHVKKIFGSLLQAFMEETGQQWRAAGSTTFKKMALEKGLEPDECYWVPSAEAMRGVVYDAEVHPSPDVAVQVDITRSALNRLKIYAALGFSEVLRYRRGRIEVYRIGPAGQYTVVPASVAVPNLPLAEIARHIDMRSTLLDSEILRSFRRLIRAAQDR